MDAPVAAEEIVIVAPRLAEAPGERAYSRAEIDAGVIEDALRLDDALRSVPGVATFRRNSSSAANPTIQGLSVRASAPSGAGRTLVLLDGAPLNDPFGGWVIWGAVPPDTIASARVLRGAGAGPYGAGALLGVVQLEERAGVGAALTFEGGELGYRRLSGVGEAGGDALSFMLAANVEESDGWIPVRAGRGLADVPLASDSAAAVARLQWRNSEYAFSARLNAYDESRSAGLVGADSENSGVGLSLVLAKPNGAFGWRVQAWAMESDLANASVAVAPDRDSTTPANDQLETPALGWGANAALRWTFEDSGVELGADVRASDGETRELFRFQSGAFTRTRVAGGETFVGGAYVEAWREAGPWLFSGGARVDQWRASGGVREERDATTNALTLSVSPADNDVLAPTARLGARRALSDGLVLRTAAYAGFRPPTLNELHRPFRVGNDVTEANAALEPERLMGFDLAFEGEYSAFSWSVGAFATRLEDAIVNVTLGAGPGTFPPGVFVPAGGAFRQRQNAGSIDAAGVEAEARGTIGTALDWRAALNYTDAKIAGLALAQAPEWSATAGLDWRLTPSTTLSADIAYESERFEDDLNSRVLSAATTLDLRLEQALAPNVSIYAALDNALDEAVETAETADGIESFGAPRAARFGLRVRTP
jgi:outer membrane receptor protein involved in Fe transport